MLVVETETVQSVWLCEEEKDKRRKGFTMRKTLLVIVVLFCTAQVFAATVTLEVNDIGDGWAAIRYSADANVSAFGLKVTADSGAIITDINDYNVGECTATVQGYGIFPGTIDINETTGLVDGNGTPIAPSSDPCSHTGPTGIDTNTLILEMGALYVEGNQPAQSGTLIKVQVDKNCRVCVEGESIRGNIVMTDGSSLDPNACGYVLIECYTGPDYAEWVTVGRPDSWCNPRQCHGDADGAEEYIPKQWYWVGFDDLAVLVAGFKQAYSDPVTHPWIAADFDHAEEYIPKQWYRVGFNDLAVLVAYFKQSVDPNCLD